MIITEQALLSIVKESIVINQPENQKLKVIISENQLKLAIKNLILENTIPSNKEEGNAFRAWINKSKTSEEIAALYPDGDDKRLDISGSHTNQHFLKAWSKYGEEYQKTLEPKAKEEEAESKSNAMSISPYLYDPGQGIPDKYAKIKQVELGMVYALDITGNLWYRKLGSQTMFDKISENKINYKLYTEAVSLDALDDFWKNISSEIKTNPKFKQIMVNLNLSEPIKKLSKKIVQKKAELQAADDLKIQTIFPFLQKIINDKYLSKNKLYLKGTSINKINKRHGQVSSGLQAHLQANGFPGTTVTGRYGGRDLAAAAATDNPDRIPGSTHGFHLAVDVKINSPEAGVTDYRDKGTKSNPILAKDKKLVKAINVYANTLSDYTWGGTWGGSNPDQGTVKGRGIKEFHHFELNPSEYSKYIGSDLTTALEKLGFTINDISNQSKRIEIFTKLEDTFKKGIEITKKVK